MQRFTYDEAMLKYAPEIERSTEAWEHTDRTIRTAYPVVFSGTFSIDHDARTDRYTVKFTAHGNPQKVKVTNAVATDLLVALSGGRMPAHVYLVIEDGVATDGVLVYL